MSVSWMSGVRYACRLMGRVRYSIDHHRHAVRTCGHADMDMTHDAPRTRTVVQTVYRARTRRASDIHVSPFILAFTKNQVSCSARKKYGDVDMYTGELVVRYAGVV